eukprot:14371384-Alexandrium_andersonii.AAC.2
MLHLPRMADCGFDRLGSIDIPLHRPSQPPCPLPSPSPPEPPPGRPPARFIGRCGICVNNGAECTLGSFED